MNDFTITLKKPVSADGREITSLTFRELTVAELIAIEKTTDKKLPIESDVAYFAMASGQSPETIGKLTQSDWNKIRVKYYDTLGNGNSPEMN